MPFEHLLDLFPIVRTDRLLRELLFIGSKSAVLAHPNAVAIGIDALVMYAEILVRLKRDETSLQLRHVRLFPTDRTRLLDGICVLCHSSSSLQNPL